MIYPVICKKLIELKVITAEQPETFTEHDIAKAIDGVHQALTIVAKNLEIVSAENKQLELQGGNRPFHDTSKLGIDVQQLVTAQREAIDEVRANNPSLSYVQAFNKAIRDYPNVFAKEVITVEA